MSYDLELNIWISKLESKSSGSIQTNKTSTIQPRIPILDIVPFDGNPAKFYNFKTSFQNLFNKYDLTDQENLLILNKA